MNMRMKCLLSLVCSFLLLGLSACVSSPSTETSTSQSSDLERIDLSYYPKFIEYNEGKAALIPITHATSNWELQSRQNYLFASYGRYIFRYNIISNSIDKTIDLGEPFKGWPFGITISADGRYLITYNFEFANTEPNHHYFLIDTESETVEFLCNVYDDTMVDGITNTVIPSKVKNELTNLCFKSPSPEHKCTITEELGKEEIRYVFHDQNGDSKEIATFNNITLGMGNYCIIDENRVGAIVPKSSELSGYVSFYKIIIVNIKNDNPEIEFIISSK